MLDRGEPHAGRRDEAGQPRRLRVGEALRGNRATYFQREVLLEVAVAAVEEVQAVVAGHEGDVASSHESIDHLPIAVRVDDAVRESGHVGDRGARVEPCRG